MRIDDDQSNFAFGLDRSCTENNTGQIGSEIPKIWNHDAFPRPIVRSSQLKLSLCCMQRILKNGPMVHSRLLLPRSHVIAPSLCSFSIITL